MDGGYLVNALPLVAAVVYALCVSGLFQIAVDMLRPCRPPFLRFSLLVPVGGLYRFTLILPLDRVIDFFAVLVKDIFLPLLVAPCPVLVQGAHRQEDMGVWVSVVFVVYAKVGAHSFGNKLRGTIFPDKPDMFLS